MNMSRLTIIIVSYNTRDLLRRCLAALEASRGEPPDVIVVDNASSDGSADLVAAEFPRAHLVRNERNVGFAAANNQGMAWALEHHNPDYLMLLNSDAFVAPDALQALVGYMDAHPAVGAAGPQLHNADGSLQPSGRPFPTLRSTLLELIGWTRRNGRDPFLDARRDYSQIAAVDEVSGACIIVRGSVVRAVGGLDEEFFFNYEDVDWCRRIKAAGWTIVYLPRAHVTHLWGSSQQKLIPRVYIESRRGLLRYFRKHAHPAELLALQAALVGLESATLLRWCARWALRPSLRPRARQVVPLKAHVIRLALARQGDR
jgi:N-acetylglucosaminyl-diphospho-decaprenol L-rhamnosyltransferase